MPHYYVSVLGEPKLNLREIARIADSQGGALLAVDGIDDGDLLAGTTPLPPLPASERRTYLFLIESPDREAAEDIGELILETALAERDQPVYRDFAQFLHAYPDASWRETLRARLIHYNDDRVDLQIFAPGPTKDDPGKVYYRGDAGRCCCDLLVKYTDIPATKW